MLLLSLGTFPSQQWSLYICPYRGAAAPSTVRPRFCLLHVADLAGNAPACRLWPAKPVPVTHNRPQPSLPSCSRYAFLVARPVSAAVMSPKLRQQIPSSDQLLPQLGDRVLRFQRHWLHLVLEGTKTAELRRDRTTSGCAWMGCSGRVWGRIHIGDAARLSSMEELGPRVVSIAWKPPSSPTEHGHTFGLCLCSRVCPVTVAPVTWLPFAPPPPTHVQDVHPGSGPAAAGRSLSDAASASSGPRRRRSRSASAPLRFPAPAMASTGRVDGSEAPATAAERGCLRS